MDHNKLKFSAEHIWVSLDDDSHATLGLTEEGLRDFVDLNKIRLPQEGDELVKDELFGRISVGHGTGLRLISPLSGEVLAVNDDIIDAPEAILEDPYDEGWLIRMELNSMIEFDNLMSPEEYEEYVAEEYPDDDEDDDDDDEEDDDDDYDEDDDDLEDDDDDDFFDDDEDDY